MNCPFCAARWRDFQSLARHLDFKHPGRQVFVSGEPIAAAPKAQLPTLMLQLPVAGTVFMDAIYRKRPDLIKPRSAP